MAEKPKQTILGEMFDEETVKRLEDAQDEASFELVGDDLSTDYRCPYCGSEWSGNPKPPIGTTVGDE